MVRFLFQILIFLAAFNGTQVYAAGKHGIVDPKDTPELTKIFESVTTDRAVVEIYHDSNKNPSGEWLYNFAWQFRDSEEASISDAYPLPQIYNDLTFIFLTAAKNKLPPDSNERTEALDYLNELHSFYTKYSYEGRIVAYANYFYRKSINHKFNGNEQSQTLRQVATVLYEIAGSMRNKVALEWLSTYSGIHAGEQVKSGEKSSKRASSYGALEDACDNKKRLPLINSQLPKVDEDLKQFYLEKEGKIANEATDTIEEEQFDESIGSVDHVKASDKGNNAKIQFDAFADLLKDL